MTCCSWALHKINSDLSLGLKAFAKLTNNSPTERIATLLNNCEGILFKELKTASTESVNLLNPIIGRFYNLEMLRKFTFLVDQSAATDSNELNQDPVFLSDYELEYFSQNKSFSLFDDFFTVKSILSKQLLEKRPKMDNTIRQHLTFIYNKMIDHCILHKRYQVKAISGLLWGI